AIMGIDCHIAVPKGFVVKAKYIEQAKAVAKETGAEIVQTYDPVDAVKNVDIIYTDVWTSMGKEAENEKRLQAFQDYQVNEALIQHAKDDFLFMHCLPAKRREEVTS